jgi:membrane-bound ClpP family serine protease
MNRKGFATESILYLGMAIFIMGIGIFISTILSTWNTAILGLLQIAFITMGIFFLAMAFERAI